MKFTLIKDLKQESSMKWILNLLLFFSSIYIATDIFVKYISFGITLSQITQTLFGNEEEYLEPITQAAFLEFIHMEIFFIMMLLLTLSAIFIRLFQNSSISLLILNSTMVTALLSLVCLASCFYLSESFILPYLLAFFIWHFLAFFMTLACLWRLND